MTDDTSLHQLLDGAKRRTRMRRITLAIVLVAMAVGAGSFYQFWQQQVETRGGPSYNTVAVKKGDLSSSISATGSVEAINTVEVGAEISGRILSLHADFNDAVTAGQLIATIDPEQHQASVDQAKAQMLAAEAQVAEAEATSVEASLAAERSRELAAKGLLSKRELEGAVAKETRAKAAVKSAKASAALARASLVSARSKLSKTEIVSPISGTVLSREVEVGQTINAGMQTPVLFIIAADLRRMRLSSSVDEADIGKVSEGQSATFTVDAFPSRTFDSSVTAVRNVPTTDQSVVSYEVLLSVDNESMLLKPGMTAAVEITTEKLADMLLVPNKALRFSLPAVSGRGMRAPRMPFFGASGRRGGKSGEGGAPTPLRALGKVRENQGVLWQFEPGDPTGALRPIKVDKLASDGILTAIRTDALSEGDEVVLEQVVEETP